MKIWIQNLVKFLYDVAKIILAAAVLGAFTSGEYFTMAAGLVIFVATVLAAIFLDRGNERKGG